MTATTPDSGAWADPDHDGDSAMLVIRLLHRLRVAEAALAEAEADIAQLQSDRAADRARIVTIEAHLGLVNALLHLW